MPALALESLGACLLTCRGEPPRLDWAGGSALETLVAVLPPEAAAGMPFSDWIELVHPLDQARVAEWLTAANLGVSAAEADYRLLAPSEEFAWVRHRVIEGANKPQAETGRVMVLQSIDEAKGNEAHALLVAEKVRSQIGQELHDDVCQVLTGVNYLLDVMHRRHGQKDAAMGEELRELGQQVRDCAARTRMVAHGLFPARVTGGSLAAALRELAVQTQARQPVAIEIDCAGAADGGDHEPERVLHVFRLVQEALGNAVRHGAATRIDVRLAAVKGSVSVVIEDNGCGFPAEKDRAEGIGLHSMRARAHLLGGTFSVANRSEGGARIELNYPRL